jgi:hypothetical protein
MGHAHLGGKTVLNLIDGLYSGDHNNDTLPHKWAVAPFNGGWTSSVFASQDPVAIESVLFDLFQLDDDPFQYPKIAGAEDYLSEAAQAGNPPSGTFYDPNHATATQRLASLGVFEHWNNAVDRQYSRNLGTGNGIELVFVEGVSSSIRAVSRPGGARSVYSMRAQPMSRTVELTIPESGEMIVALFDARGRLVKTVLDDYLARGNFQMDMPRGRAIPAGFYSFTLYRRENAAANLVATCNSAFLGN